VFSLDHKEPDAKHRQLGSRKSSARSRTPVSPPCTASQPEVAQTLAVDLGITIAVLDPVEGLTEDTEGEDYLSLMRVNLTALEEANGCT
jgi:hypothetical protein